MAALHAPLQRVALADPPPGGRSSRYRGQKHVSVSGHAYATAALNLTPDGRPFTLALGLAGPDRAHWETARDEEISRLLDTKTLHPCHLLEQPADRRGDTTYYNPQTKEKRDEHTNVKTYRVRGAAGGDRINYPGAVAARCADLELVKLLINLTISEPNRKWMTMDISDFYLHSTLERPEWIRITRKHLSDNVLDKYQLWAYLVNGSILFRIDKGMYGLPQAGLLAKTELTAHLAAGGYHEDPLVPCLFTHVSNGVKFSLVVDDFGVSYTDPAGAEHLHQHLLKRYPHRINWDPKKYLGITIVFDYALRTATLSMPGYMDKVILRFHRLLSTGRPQAASPCVYVPPSFGQSTQYTHLDTTAALSPEDKLEMQELVGCVLYYARAVDCTMLPTVNHISSVQSTLTRQVQAMGQRLLAYGAAYPNNELVYRASGMFLRVQSDFSHLSRPDSRGVVGGIGYLGTAADTTSLNGAVFAISSLLDVVVASVAEGEYGSVFVNAKHAVGTRTILAALGYPQPATPIFTDNACAVGLATDTVKVKRGKSIDMRFHWIRDRIKQNQFSVSWIPGTANLADFFTKALPVKRHQELMKLLVNTPLPSAAHFTSYRGRQATAYRHHKLLLAPRT